MTKTAEKQKQQIFRPKPVSGFPEWLPEVRYAEQVWFDHIRQVFESYGFCSIETPSVEALDVLRAKGEVDKEIYVIERLHKEDDDNSEARLALHFDQTVPLARYVAQHFNDLTFPFKRYQIQRVWRGERPQAGRFREFYQCDIDVIGVDNLSLHFDAEMPAIIWEILSQLPGMEGEKFQIRISNRKILLGLLDHMKIENAIEVGRILDKTDKIGADAVHKELIDSLGISQEAAQRLCALASVKSNDIDEILNAFSDDERQNETLTSGLEDIKFVADYLSQTPTDFIMDLSIVRGLDYYTGTVYETVLIDDPGYGSICSGGRYDDLASSYINKNLPGVGISIGFSRLFERVRQSGKLDTNRKSPADILVILPSEEQRIVATETAQILRRNGHKVELYHAPQKLQKQLAYAEKKGIPYVWFPPFEDGKPHEVKDMQSGVQSVVEPDNWQVK